MPQETILAADLVLPVAVGPIRDGAVLIRDGRIAAVGPLADIRRSAPKVEVRSFAGHAIVPGAVNAHGHLGFRRKDKPAGASFSVWLKELISKLPEKESWTAEAARDSAREAVEAGTTYMAESSPYGECLPQLAESGMAGTVHAEFFPGDYPGMSPQERVDAIFESARKMSDGLPARVDCQVSVHSPYTVDPVSAGLAAVRSRKEGGRLAIHLSESPEEVEFILEGTGGLAEIFESADWRGRGISPVQYFEETGVLGSNVIAAHLATSVSKNDLDILKSTNTAAAHCPRSNEYLKCEVSPLPAMLERGIRVGMGTDGLWSSPSLNLFEETLFAIRLHGMDGALGLELATLGGARALGIEDEAGSIEVGKYADLAVVAVAPDGVDAEMEVVEVAAGGGVAATVVSGEFVYNQTSS
ncbi:MAG: amidohydrolase family protein [Actinomycetota bacterium]|nr:amidohydrolase family protein [Actinomycetota bacterium]